MTKGKHAFQFVIYESDDDTVGAYIAHCLNMDVLADDDTVEGAVSNLLETIEVTLEMAGKHSASLFRDAPRKYWDMYASAQQLPAELMERIVYNANKGRVGEGREFVNIESQCELRTVATIPA